MGRRHEREIRRLNERSMRRAIVASVVIVGDCYIGGWRQASRHTPLGISGCVSRFPLGQFFFGLAGHKAASHRRDYYRDG